MTDQPKTIGKYGVRSVIVVTRYSIVYRCDDPDLQAPVAVKVFDPKSDDAQWSSVYGDAYWRERFLREARLLARLDHPHIVQVRELAVDARGNPYFVMPFIEANLIYEIGRDALDAASLPENDRPRRVAPERALVLLRQLLSALALLHSHGFVHRDVSPANVLLTRRKGGAVKLADFGMVKFPQWSESGDGAWLGTLDYIAPEQRENAKTVAPSADVYAAAALGYRMLTGRLPAGRFPTLVELGIEVPPALDDLLMQSLSPQPSARPKDAGELLRRLNAAANSPVSSVRVISITRDPE